MQRSATSNIFFVVERFYSTVSVDLCPYLVHCTYPHLPDGLSRLHTKAVLLHKVHSRRALSRSSRYGVIGGFRHLSHRGSASTKLVKTSNQPQSDKYIR